jgi:FixJ family two-component response regulator
MTGAAGKGSLLDIATLLGAQQIVEKPFSSEELRRVVQRALEGSR